MSKYENLLANAFGVPLVLAANVKRGAIAAEVQARERMFETGAQSAARAAVDYVIKMGDAGDLDATIAGGLAAPRTSPVVPPSGDENETEDQRKKFAQALIEGLIVHLWNHPRDVGSPRS